MSDPILELLASPPAPSMSVDEVAIRRGGRRRARRRQIIRGSSTGLAVAAAAAFLWIGLSHATGELASPAHPVSPAEKGSSPRLSAPPAGASAAVVMDTYLRALLAGDCATARALATASFSRSNGELCGDVRVTSFSLSAAPATPSRDEVIFGAVLTTGGSKDGTIPRGKITWFYDLKRQDGLWRLVGGGSGP